MALLEQLREASLRLRLVTSRGSRLLVSYSASTAPGAGAAALILGNPQGRPTIDSGSNTVRERCDGTPDAPAAPTRRNQLHTTTPNAAD